MSDAKASNGAQDPTPSVANDIVVPQPRINRRQVLKGGAAAATVTAAGPCAAAMARAAARKSAWLNFGRPMSLE